jgi:two-component system, sensor histidine kinase YesM
MFEWLHFKTIRGKFLMLTTIIIIAPMLVLSFVTYQISAQKLGENVSRSGKATIEMGGHYLDRMIIDLYDLFNVVQGNSLIQQLLIKGYMEETDPSSVKNDDYRYVRNLRKMREALNGIMMSKPYIVSYLIYHEGASPDKRLYANSGAYLSPNRAELWVSELTARGTIVWRDNESLQNSTNPQNSIIVGKKLKKITDDYGDLGFILIEIDKDAFFQGLTFLRSASDSYSLITDESGHPIYSITDSGKFQHVLSITEQIKIPSKQTVWKLRRSGNEYIVQYVENERTNWKLFNIMEASKLSEEARVIRGITILVFLLLLIIGWFLALWVSNTVTRPLKKLSSLIRSGMTGSHRTLNFDETDEVGQIGVRFIRVNEENKELHKQVYAALLRRKEAEIQALQAQINPHFLYNTLESLNWLAISRKQFDISEVVGSLGKFFRLAIGKGSDMISIEDELEHAKAYVKVQQFRYKDKFDFYMEIEAGLMKCYVPKFILQPIVENCIYHGLKQKSGQGTILISGETHDNHVYIRITDDGVGIPAERLSEVQKALSGDATSTVYGIKNVHDRIQMRYGMNNGIFISSIEGQYTTVTVKLPVIYIPNEEREL